jgi:hypothetical protein
MQRSGHAPAPAVRIASIAAQSRGHSAHIGQDIIVHYRWHPLCGQSARRIQIERRASGEFVHVEMTPGVVTILPSWKLDAVYCAGLKVGAPLGNDAPVAQARFSPDGVRIVAASGDKTARLWNLKADNGNLVSQARAIVPRCLTPAQRKAFYLPREPPTWCIEMVKWPYDTPEWKRWLVNKRAGKNPPLPVAP